jgi:hypothetical protein
MESWKPAFAAATAALALAGCGSDEPPPFKTLTQPASATTPSLGTSESEVTTDSAPAFHAMLSKVGARGRARIAPIVSARDALAGADGDLAAASTDAQQIVERIGTGNAAPGGAAHEVARLSGTLNRFVAVLRPMSLDTMLPRLSSELSTQAAHLKASRPAVAAKLLAANDEVNSAIGLVPRLAQRIEDARTVVREQQLQESLDAEKLHEAIVAGGQNATSALGQVDSALSAGLTALAFGA